MFDFYGELLTVKSVSDVVELTTTHSRKQFDTVSAQVKELSALAQKVAAELVEPLKAGVEQRSRPPPKALFLPRLMKPGSDWPGLLHLNATAASNDKETAVRR